MIEMNKPGLDSLLLMPKIDLHRHLEGSIRINTLYQLAKEIGLDITSKSDLSSKVQIHPSQPYNLENFLSKFAFLRKFYQSKEIIQRISQECIQDAIQDNLKYLELRFSPSALTSSNHFKFEDVISWIIEVISEEVSNSDLIVRTIVSINRHEPVGKAELIFREASQFKSQGLMGFDLSGDEANFQADPFVNLFQKAKKENFYITIHAGEWGPASNVLQAIEQFGADRIGHGIRVMEDMHVLEIARKLEIPFEVCITSNIQSGIADIVSKHPIKKMISSELKVTVNTDDPAISNIRLTDEFAYLNNKLGISIPQIFLISKNAIEASFLSSLEKQRLYEHYSSAFSLWQKKMYSSDR
ncbi:MAG: adenosine deaminase [Chloroflexi bacterium HGW-Chloroflexi-8]|nr:MAG: adenosine deaminase [Chloroflexi bacterium HGW-Chloroflexi-8]